MSKLYFLLFCCIGITSTFLGRKTEYIVFSSDRGGNSDLYRMKSDGSNIERLTVSRNKEWSPRVQNKQEISFLQQKGEKFYRFLFNFKTKTQSPILQPNNCVLDDKNAMLSPDKSQLLYACDGHIYISDALGNQPKDMTPGSKANNFNPVWFPDGKKIAFTTDRDSNLEIYSQEITGHYQQVVNLTNSDADEDFADISPLGDAILFNSNRDSIGARDIFIQNLASGAVENITNTPANELIARWGRNADNIYYGSDRDGNWEIYKYSVKKKTSTNLTNNKHFDGDPVLVY